MSDNPQEKDLNNPKTWKESGNEFFNKGQYEEAVKCYSHAIELDQNFIEAWNNLGLSLLKLGKIEESKKCNEKVKELKEKIKPQKQTIPTTPTTQTTKKAIDTEYCRNCGEELPYKQGEWPVSLPKICPSCGVRVKDPIRYGSREGQGRTHKEGLKNPRIAALLSIIPGLGQLYNGQLGKGVLFFIVTILGFILIIPGLIVWIYGIYDAFKTAKRMNYGDIPFQELKTKNILVFFSLLIIGGLIIVGISTMITKPALFTKSSEQTISLGILAKKTLDNKYIMENGNEKIAIDVSTYLYDKCNLSYLGEGWCKSQPTMNYLYTDVAVENVGNVGIKSDNLKVILIDYAGFEKSSTLKINGMYPGDKRKETLVFKLGTDEDQEYQKKILQDFKLKCIFGKYYVEWTIPKCESCLNPTPIVKPPECMIGKWIQQDSEQNVYINIYSDKRIEYFQNNQIQSWGNWETMNSYQYSLIWTGGKDISNIASYICPSYDCKMLDVLYSPGGHTTFVRA